MLEQKKLPQGLEDTWRSGGRISKHEVAGSAVKKPEVMLSERWDEASLQQPHPTPREAVFDKGVGKQWVEGLSYGAAVATQVEPAATLSFTSSVTISGFVS